MTLASAGDDHDRSAAVCRARVIHTSRGKPDVLVSFCSQAMTRHTSARVLSSIVPLALAVVLIGCSPISPSPASRLRIANKGPAGLQQLTLAFPNDQTFFGGYRSGNDNAV